MDLRATAQVGWPPPEVLAEVADLATYPSWLGIVRRAEPAAGRPGDPGPAWMVDMGAGVGPLRLVKRVRMVRAALEPGGVRFVRAEADQAEHHAWVLAARVEPPGSLPDPPGSLPDPPGPLPDPPGPLPEPRGTRLTMDLHYGGRAWGPLVDAVLAGEVRRAGGRLEAWMARGRRPVDGSGR